MCKHYQQRDLWLTRCFWWSSFVLGCWCRSVLRYFVDRTRRLLAVFSFLWICRSTCRCRTPRRYDSLVRLTMTITLTRIAVRVARYDTGMVIQSVNPHYF